MRMGLNPTQSPIHPCNKPKKVNIPKTLMIFFFVLNKPEKAHVEITPNNNVMVYLIIFNVATDIPAPPFLAIIIL